MKKLKIFRALLTKRASTIINEAAQHVERTTRTHFVHGAKDAAGELRDAGFPLSASGFRPGAAGLTKEWDVLIQSGHLNAAYGSDVIVFDPARKRFRVFVGFDDSAPGSPRGFSFGDPSSSFRTASPDMRSLLSWIMDGTSRMVGRPIIANGFFQAYPGLVTIVARHGFVRRARSSPPRAYPVSRGRRLSPITPT